jgi:hypothetical protein
MVSPAPFAKDRYHFGLGVDGTVSPGHPFDPDAAAVSGRTFKCRRQASHDDLLAG